LISSYPKSWTSRYFQLGYQRLDPVVLRARAERDLFCWGGAGRISARTRAQRQFQRLRTALEKSLNIR